LCCLDRVDDLFGCVLVRLSGSEEELEEDASLELVE
jgi:hypothetical protein